MDNITSRIKKLLALAQNNPNEAEAASAMAKASALMMEHGITQEALGDIKEGGYFPVDYIHHRILAQAAGMLYGVTPVGTFTWEEFRFVGRPENIQAAADTYVFLVDQVESLYKALLPKGMSKQTRANFRREFKKACAGRVYDRVAHIVAEQCLPSESNSRALVVQDHRKTLEAEVDNFLSGKIEETTLSAVINPYSMGARVGTIAGEHVELNRKVD